MKSIDTSAARRGGLLNTLMAMLALCWCATAFAGAPMPAVTSVSTITGITLERNCFGCASGSVLVLNRNGTATYTTTGNARAGTESKTSNGAISPDEFDKLARLAESKGFFEMNEKYEDPQLQDGPWTTIRIARGSQDKLVFRRDDAGPATLKAVESAIDSARAQIKFSP